MDIFGILNTQITAFYWKIKDKVVEYFTEMLIVAVQAGLRSRAYEAS